MLYQRKQVAVYLFEGIWNIYTNMMAVFSFFKPPLKHIWNFKTEYLFILFWVRFLMCHLKYSIYALIPETMVLVWKVWEKEFPSCLMKKRKYASVLKLNLQHILYRSLRVERLVYNFFPYPFPNTYASSNDDHELLATFLIFVSLL